MSDRPYVVYPPGWPASARARAFGDLAAAKRAAQKIADETGEAVSIMHVPRFGGRVWSRAIIVRPRQADAARAQGKEDS